MHLSFSQHWGIGKREKCEVAVFVSTDEDVMSARNVEEADNL